MVSVPEWPEMRIVLTVMRSSTMDFIVSSVGAWGSPSLKMMMCLRLAVDFLRAS